MFHVNWQKCGGTARGRNQDLISKLCGFNYSVFTVGKGCSSRHVSAQQAFLPLNRLDSMSDADDLSSFAYGGSVQVHNEV